jgi:hypothetical protein
MPWISDQDMAEFQRLKGGGGGSAQDVSGDASYQAFLASTGQQDGPAARQAYRQSPQYQAAAQAHQRQAYTAAPYQPGSPPAYQAPPSQPDPPGVHRLAATQVSAADNALMARSPGWAMRSMPGTDGTPHPVYVGAGNENNPNAPVLTAPPGEQQKLAQTWQQLGRDNPDMMAMPRDAQGYPLDGWGNRVPGGQPSAAQASAAPAPGAQSRDLAGTPANATQMGTMAPAAPAPGAPPPFKPPASPPPGPVGGYGWQLPPGDPRMYARQGGG